MWGFDWLWSFLTSLGLTNKSGKILLLGLDNAGKTTLMHMLCDNRLVQHYPTRAPTSQEFSIGRVNFCAYDMGGHKEARRLWKDYFQGVDGIIYMVDSADGGRLEESKCELDGLLSQPELEKTPIVVLGNKIDMDYACSEPQLREVLGLHMTTGKGEINVADNVRPIEVFMCSVANREGYADGIKWLSQYI